MSQARVIDDLLKAAGGAVSFASSARAQLHQEIKERVTEMADRMDLVPREDFEKLERQLHDTNAKIAALEQRLTALEPKAAKKTGKK